MSKFVSTLLKRSTLIVTSFVLAVSSLSAAMPLFLSQTANAIPGSEIVYNALPSVSPHTNYPSYGAQAHQFNEFGDRVELGGTNRQLETVTATLTDWAKESDANSVTWCSNNPTKCTVDGYYHNITLNVHKVDGTVIATETNSVLVPWRPESDPTCAATNNGNGWKEGSTCFDFSGIAFNTTFNFSSNTILPNDVILGVAYNTQTHGYSPTGVAGPYNSLNVTFPDYQSVTTGTDNSVTHAYVSTPNPSYWGTASTNFSEFETWPGSGTVAFQVTALPVDTSSTTFVNDPKYVRVNNGGDLAAQIVTPNTTTGVKFFVDGNTSSPISGSNIGGAGATTDWWRLHTPLAAGEHTISAQIEVGGSWYDVTDSGTVYSLDSPWAEYTIPQTGQFFRANDKVVRIKADDQFNQFKYMKTTINGITHTVNRADCSDKGSYVLCDLQNLNLPEGTYTASTTTYTMANNRVDNLVSPEFTIDNTKPTLTNFQITSPSSIYGNSIPVSVDATDTNGINDVSFYVTAPRVGDGVCDGNGIHLSTTPGVLSTGSTYTATLNTSGLNGYYCLNAIASDVATNHSSISKMKVLIDTTAPDAPNGLSMKVTSSNVNIADGASTNKSDVTASWLSNNTEPVTFIYKYWNDITGNQYKVGSEYPVLTSSTSYSGVLNQGEGVHHFCVVAVDLAGNESACSAPFTVGYDITNPSATITTTGTQSTATPTISGTVGADATNLVFTIDGITQPLTWAAGSTTWTSTPTTALADGTHNMSIVATDNAGNEGGQVGTITISVPAPLITPLATTPGGGTGTPTPTPEATVTPGEVLGDQTTNEDAAKTDDSKANPSASILGDATSNPMNLFGLAWYWWLAILAAIIALWWSIAAALRRRDNQNV